MDKKQSEFYSKYMETTMTQLSSKNIGLRIIPQTSGRIRRGGRFDYVYRAVIVAQRSHRYRDDAAIVPKVVNW